MEYFIKLWLLGPQHNRRVEWKHRHIFNVARALRFQENLPKRFWGECGLTARYLINRSIFPSEREWPFELLYGHVPSYSYIKIFGYLLLMIIIYLKINSGLAIALVFSGVFVREKGMRLYDIEAKKFLISQDVIFDETQFLYVAEGSTAFGKNFPSIPNYGGTTWIEQQTCVD